VVTGGLGAATDGVGEGLGPTLAAAENAGGGLASDLARLAEQHITDTGDTVLGRFPGYITKALSKGASYFDIGSEWDRLLAEGVDPWDLNQHFLDTRIAAGDRMLLSVPKNDVLPGTYLAREIGYLVDNGYRWVNQWALKPGG
jgi:hypothetical protein